MTTTLFLVCGKIAAGKTTLAARLAAQHGACLLSEDHWLASLFSDELETLSDYRRCSLKLREAIGPHVVELLRNGLSVVMDFPANTPEQRSWLHGLSERANVPHQLHSIEATDDLCKSRLKARNETGDHQFQVSEAQFDQFTTYFVPPDPNENLNVIPCQG
ncbi:MAG: AAA family ATPase [Parvularcula sp.]